MRRPTPLGKAPRRQRGFTLIELILVMAMLLVVLSLAAPSLARFFRGRDLDSEAQRFLALTRYGQSRAVAEGVPMVLWMDLEQRRYGLEAEFTYADYDEQAVEFSVDEDLEMEAAPLVKSAVGNALLPQELPPPRPGSQRPAALRYLVLIRFAPDATLGDPSPQWVAFRPTRAQDAASARWVAQSRNRLRYEIRTNEPPILR